MQTHVHANTCAYMSRERCPPLLLCEFLYHNAFEPTHFHTFSNHKACWTDLYRFTTLTSRPHSRVILEKCVWCVCVGTESVRHTLSLSTFSIYTLESHLIVGASPSTRDRCVRQTHLRRIAHANTCTYRNMYT